MRMQPGVTVVLATVWLVVSVDVVGAATLHPSHLAPDQYSPLPPYHHGVYRRDEDQLDWTDQNPIENRPFDLSIGPRRSISVNESPKQSFEAQHQDRDFIFPRTVDDSSFNDDVASLKENKQSHSYASPNFMDERVSHKGTKIPEPFSRDVPPTELAESFVADDTFQDQGPGSVEIYKLDLFKEKALLSPTPSAKPLTKSKSKIPKKTSRVNWKAKTTEYKTTSPKTRYRQPNSIHESRTGIPPNTESFGVGGVPELQVGCEGLEASSQKLKRSIDASNNDNDPGHVDPWLDVTPVSLDLEYELSSEDAYEEMDELLKLKKLETTTKKIKQNRGDMEATLHLDEFFGDKRASEKLPVRGDLGKSNESAVTQLSGATSDQKKEGLHFDKAKGDDLRKRDEASRYSDGTTANRGRKLLSFDESKVEEHLENQERSKRSLWGFGEDEGVASSDELQTENERRRQAYERRRKEEERRRQEEAKRRGGVDNRTDSEIEDIREEYAKMLEQRRREEEERRRRIQQEDARRAQYRQQSPRDDLEEERRRRLQDEEAERRNRWQEQERRRQELEASRRGYDRRRIPSEGEVNKERKGEEETRGREQDRLREEERRRQQLEEERRRRVQEEEMRREEHNRWQAEMQRRRQDEEDRRNLQDRQREWMMKRRQEEEEERRKLERDRNVAPSNLLNPPRSNDSRRYESESARRMREQEEREREEKLREYIQRNRPINVDRSAERREELERRRVEQEKQSAMENENRRRQMEEENRRLEEQRRRLEEERKLQEYIRRNQPVHVPKTNGSYDRNWIEERRTIEEARPYGRAGYSGTGTGRRNHGPSAPTNIDPGSYVDQARRRQETRRFEEESRIRDRERYQEEERRREAMRREEEFRRMQSRRYEEERKRQEAVRLDAERRRQELVDEEARRSQAGRTRPLENTRPEYQDRRVYEEHRRRQDPSLIPGNLVLDESRRAAERERQRQEQERRRVEAERRRQEENRMKEARHNDEHARAMKEQRRRQEEARLNALPVSARIIVRSELSSNPSNPVVISRTGFANEIDFSGINPNQRGVEASKFPAAATTRPPARTPGPCVWAVIQCCPSSVNRLATCFESMGCPGANWDPNPCRGSIAEAAREEVMKFYAAADRDDRF